MGRLRHKKVFSLKSFVIPVLLFSHLVALSVKKKKKQMHGLGREEKATWKLKALGLRDFFKLTLFLSSFEHLCTYLDVPGLSCGIRTL